MNFETAAEHSVVLARRIKGLGIAYFPGGDAIVEELALILISFPPRLEEELVTACSHMEKWSIREFQRVRSSLGQSRLTLTGALLTEVYKDPLSRWLQLNENRFEPATISWLLLKADKWAIAEAARRRMPDPLYQAAAEHWDACITAYCELHHVTRLWPAEARAHAIRLRLESLLFMQRLEELAAEELLHADQKR